MKLVFNHKETTTAKAIGLDIKDIESLGETSVKSKADLTPDNVVCVFIVRTCCENIISILLPSICVYAEGEYDRVMPAFIKSFGSGQRSVIIEAFCDLPFEAQVEIVDRINQETNQSRDLLITRLLKSIGISRKP